MSDQGPDWSELLRVVIEATRADLEHREAAREQARTLTRLIGTAIRALHHGEEYAEASIEAEAGILREALRSDPGLTGEGAVRDVWGEYAEFRVLRALVAGQAPPSATDLDIPPSAYLLGLGDVVGELRRQCLEALKDGDMLRARLRFDQMEDLERALAGVHERVDGLRRKQDVARSLVERTRGELAMTLRLHRLEQRLGERVSATADDP